MSHCSLFVDVQRDLALAQHAGGSALELQGPSTAKKNWCYADQDFVGVVKRIAGASTAGKSIEFVADALLTKVAIGKAIHYAKNDRPLVWKSWHLRTSHAGPEHSKTD